MIRKKLATVFIIYTRYALGGALVFASIIKIKGKRFTTESGEKYPIDTAWHMFETFYQSGLFWEFIGWTQLLIGALLMTQKWSRLGSFLCFPLTLNIFVITLSYYFAYTPVITGLMVLANLLLILWEWPALKVLLNLTPQLKKPTALEAHPIWSITGILLFLFTVIYRSAVLRYDLLLWLSVCLMIGTAAFLTAVFKLSIFRSSKASMN